MAEGRMLNKRISEDEAVDALSSDTCRLAFSWTIPHLDRDGRVIGDPRALLHKVFPLRDDLRPADMEGFVQEWREAGLVIWYRVGSRLCLEFPGFRRNQRKLRYEQEAPSAIPPPDSASEPVSGSAQRGNNALTTGQERSDRASTTREQRGSNGEVTQEPRASNVSTTLNESMNEGKERTNEGSFFPPIDRPREDSLGPLPPYAGGYGPPGNGSAPGEPHANPEAHADQKPPDAMIDKALESLPFPIDEARKDLAAKDKRNKERHDRAMRDFKQPPKSELRAGPDPPEEVKGWNPD